MITKIIIKEKLKLVREDSKIGKIDEISKTSKTN